MEHAHKYYYTANWEVGTTAQRSRLEAVWRPLQTPQLFNRGADWFVRWGERLQLPPVSMNVALQQAKFPITFEDGMGELWTADAPSRPITDRAAQIGFRIAA